MKCMFANLTPYMFAVLAVVFLSACVVDEQFEEIELRQRSSMNLVDFDVWLYIGDIERGRRVEDVKIEADDKVLASDSSMDIGDTLDFTYRNRDYRLHVVDLIDDHPTLNDPFPDDTGVFGLEKL